MENQNNNITTGQQQVNIEAVAEAPVTENIDASAISAAEAAAPQHVEPQVQPAFSSVAINSDRKKITFVVAIAAIISATYFIFFRDATPQEKQEEYARQMEASKARIVQQAVSVPKTTVVTTQQSTTLSKMPEPVPLKEPTPPAPPPPPMPAAPAAPVIADPNAGKMAMPQAPQIMGMPGQPKIAAANQPNPFESGGADKKKKLDAKRKASVMVTGGGGGGQDKADGKSDDKKDKDAQSANAAKKPNEFLGFGNGSLDKVSMAASSAPQVVATKVSNLDRTILQGKIINAILETAVNTDIPGTLRAIVTRDVYSESGKNILIQKGSRLIGQYQSDVKPGQTRVNVMWDRLIKPDGIDIAIASAGTDQLGRTGVVGNVDTKFLQQITNAFLISYIIPMAAEKIGGGGGSISKQDAPGANGGPVTTTTTGSSKDMMMQQSASQFSQLASDAIKNTTAITPTITIDQGASITILVQRDLIFPADSLSSGNMVMP